MYKAISIQARFWIHWACLQKNPRFFKGQLKKWTRDSGGFTLHSLAEIYVYLLRKCSDMQMDELFPAFAQIRGGQPDVAGMVTKSFLSTYLIFQMREGQKVNCVLASMD